ncbi:MAG: glycosyltransferase family 39 protein [Bacteroides sp.]|nr:glycosyltransferase family 39 protein [Bacteroides sp.]
MMRNRWLPLFYFLALLPLFLLRDYTPTNELRYLNIVDEALANRTFFTFTNQGELYADKPPLYFWMAMLGRWLFGNHYMWFLSLLSFLPAVVLIQVMDRWVGKESNRENRFSGQLMLMGSGLFLGLTVIHRMDMLMCMFIVLTLYTFYRLYKQEAHVTKLQWLFAIFLFLALFSKGPIGLVVPLLSTIVFLGVSGKIKTIGRYWGWRTWVVLLGGCLLWFLGVYLEGGDAYLSNLLFHQTVNRAVDSFHHKEPFYYYMVSYWYSLAPWSLFLFGVLLVSVFRRYIRTDLERFFAVILLTTFVFLSSVSSKIQIYMAPAFPFFVYLPVLLLSRFRWNRWLAFTLAVPAGIYIAAFPAILIFSRKGLSGLANGWLYAAAAVLMCSGVICMWLLYRKKELNKSINTLGIGLFCTIFVVSFSLPQTNAQIGYKDLSEKALELAQTYHTTGYCAYTLTRPENMDVFLHEDVERVTREDVLEGKCAGKIFFIRTRRLDRDEELRHYLDAKVKYVVGKHTVVVL